jgi:hypothetical protein
MRIGIALVVLADLFIRVSDFKAFYSNEGIWPVKVMYNLGWQDGFWSLHALFPNQFGSICLFCIHILFALFLLLGYKSTLSTTIVWLLYISLHNRNLFILQSGDDLLRLTLFWGIFLNWGSQFSLDSIKSKQPSSSLSLAQPAYLMLIATVYLFTVLLKEDKEWRSEGTAIYYALSLEQMRLAGLGDFLYQHSVLMKGLTFFVYYLELSLPLLLLWPSKSGRTRGLAFLLILLLHAGIGLSLFVGLFFWISICSALALIPGSFFDRLSHRFNRFAVPPDLAAESSGIPILGSAITGMVLLFCFFINLSSLYWFPLQLNKELRFVNNVLRFNQYWGMFSPGILKNDGWMVYHGIDSLGRQWDLQRNTDYVDYSKPERIASLYKNDRWRKLSENMQNERFLFLRHLYANYYLKNWNLRHPEKRIKTLNLYFMEQESLPDYNETAPKKILYAVSCEP